MKGSGTKGLEESLSLKIQEATSKSVAITEKEEKKTICQTNGIHQAGALTYKN